MVHTVQFVKGFVGPAAWRTPTGGFSPLFGTLTVNLSADSPWVAFVAPDGRVWYVRAHLIDWVGPKDGVTQVTEPKAA